MGAIGFASLMGALVFSFLCAHRLVLMVWALRQERGVKLSQTVKGLARKYLHALQQFGPVQSIQAKTKQRVRVEQIEQCMPEVLRLMSIALDAGASLPNALEYAANNSEEPLAGELKKTVWDMQAGQGFDEAMQGLRSRAGGSEFAFLSAAMEIQHRSGGSFTGVLTTVSRSLKQSAELQDDLLTKTTQGRMSARIVALMPFVLLAVLSFFSPGYLSGFFESLTGICMLVLALLLEVLGVVLVNKALAVDVRAHAGEGGHV